MEGVALSEDMISPYSGDLFHEVGTHAMQKNRPLGVPARSDTNRLVQLQKMARRENLDLGSQDYFFFSVAGQLSGRLQYFSGQNPIL